MAVNAAEAADGGRAMQKATERAADGVLVATAMAVATMAGAVVARRRQLARSWLEAAAWRGKTVTAATAMAGSIWGAVRGLAAQAGGSDWRLGLAWLARAGEAARRRRPGGGSEGATRRTQRGGRSEAEAATGGRGQAVVARSGGGQAEAARRRRRGGGAEVEAVRRRRRR